MVNEIVQFWFEEVKPQQWWTASADLDQEIKNRFFRLHQQACRAELFLWRSEPEGRLAEILLLDQFSRNIFRDSALAFHQDPMALVLAQEAIAVGADKRLPPIQRNFLYLPFMHSESRLIHQTAEQLFRELGLAESYDFELRHKAIIDRFGRYPHRNQALGRDSTREEIEFLQQPGSRF